MAARKPKNPFNDLADLVKSQMYGSKPTTVSTQKKIKDVGTLVKTVDTFATGGLGRAVVADSKAQARGANVPVNLATYGVTSLAAGAVGAVVAKGAVVAAKTAAKTGIPARVANKITGQMIGVHGSPVSGLKTINPTLGPSAIREGYTNPQVYAANPVVGKSLSTATDYSQITGDQKLNRLTQYLRGEKTLPSKNDSIGGSVYIVKGKIGPIKKEIKKDFANSATPVPKLKNFPIMVSSKSFKVVKEFPVKDDLSTFYNDLKRYGGKLPKKK